MAINNIGFLISLAVFIVSFNMLLFTLVSSKYTTKPILMVIVLVSSLTNYFMNSYHVVIDKSMIRNTLQTNLHESMDLLSFRQILYFIFLGVLPSYLIYKSDIKYQSLKIELISKIKTILFSLLVMIASVMTFGKHYASFLREHKALRFSINPTTWIYSIGKYANSTFSSDKIIVKPIGLDAKIINKSNKHKIVIMVVGESARADHFSLNGYKKETNPLLKKEGVIDFPKFYSCGTSTAHSVPCMFSIFSRTNYSYKKGISNENVLDILKHTNNISILWRDNNSNSKGVAIRVPYQDYKTSKNNTICDHGECRDEGMLVGLDRYIKKHKNKDMLIILHQMGNHGPAYYKRYTKDFERFKPVCKTNQLEECSKDEISNAYDNAILYTDYFLSKTINLLKRYQKRYGTAMIYMSDHGESLGEHGIYLHGLPYFMAPDAQRHIGALIWLGSNTKTDISKIEQNRNEDYSQDNLFHTLLGIFGVKTKVYKKDMDILNVD